MRSQPSFTASLLVALIGATSLATVARADIYKFVDARGQVHYSDRAPSDATQVKGPAPPAQAPVPQSAQAAPRPTTPTTVPAPPLPVSDQQNQQVQRDVANARADQCKQARENYDKSVRAQRFFRTNEKGEREFMNPAEADAARLQMKAEMDSVCGS